MDNPPFLRLAGPGRKNSCDLAGRGCGSFLNGDQAMLELSIELRFENAMPMPAASALVPATAANAIKATAKAYSTRS